MAESVCSWLRRLEREVDGRPFNQLQHSLETAARAERANATDAWIVAALCHDIAKVFAWRGHGPIGAAILRPYVDDEIHAVVRHHASLLSPRQRGDARGAPHELSSESWYPAATRFVFEWDHGPSDSTRATPPLEHFEPLLESFFARPRRGQRPRWDRGLHLLIGLERRMAADVKRGVKGWGR